MNVVTTRERHLDALAALDEITVDELAKVWTETLLAQSVESSPARRRSFLVATRVLAVATLSMRHHEALQAQACTEEGAGEEQMKGHEFSPWGL
ncbi:hypothetical protein RCO28_20715 [Streptomyces sp. LHD-70]|uniref:hypothetical protein n=1 Tax=Streptomyces sp. LHD-70 TaxID=3072140 RepID=UPI00280DBF87|nr:hypothetical protein [Streptomyces sp. LHD-70]MDQ8704896.1 hypothetical protein [Streptomyces sp. LHD-70]